MQKHLIYVGDDIAIPGTAMNTHVINMGKLFVSIGYDVSFLSIGKSRRGADLPDTFKVVSHTFQKGILSKLENAWHGLTGLRLYHHFRNEARKRRPDAVVIYGYQGETQIIRYCSKHKIPVMIERVDWFEREDVSGKLDKYFFYPLHEWIRKKHDIKANGIIAISEYLANYYQERGMPVIIVPPVFDLREHEPVEFKEQERKLKLVYAGSLGGTKDILLPAIDAVIEANKQNNGIIFDIVGVSRELLGKYYSLDVLDTYGIAPHGRRTHEETLKIIRDADFGFLLRQNKRYAKAGFSTKLSENMCEGVPVICTKVGGCDAIITNMYDGITIADNDVQTILEVLIHLTQMPRAQICSMKANARATAEKMFDLNMYSGKMERFLHSICSHGKEA